MYLHCSHWHQQSQSLRGTVWWRDKICWIGEERDLSWEPPHTAYIKGTDSSKHRQTEPQQGNRDDSPQAELQSIWKDESENSFFFFFWIRELLSCHPFQYFAEGQPHRWAIGMLWLISAMLVFSKEAGRISVLSNLKILNVLETSCLWLLLWILRKEVSRR